MKTNKKRVIIYKRIISITVTLILVISVFINRVIRSEAATEYEQTQVTESWIYISSAADISNRTMVSGNYYISNNITFSGTNASDASNASSGLKISGNVNIFIPKDVTLTANGGNGYYEKPGYPGIELNSGNTLNILGEGKVVAKGGKAGNGRDGSGADNPTYASNRTYYYPGKGGDGGNGGGGAGAGIGTLGGTGGTKGTGGSGGTIRYGSDGSNGSPGNDSEYSIGTLYISASIDKSGVSGGDRGDGGTGGAAGNSGPHRHEIHNGGLYSSCGKSGGGGGGAGGFEAVSIGTGGRGGSGGGGGGSAAAISCSDTHGECHNYISNPDATAYNPKCDSGGGTGGNSGLANAGANGGGTRGSTEADSYVPSHDHYRGNAGGAGGSGANTSTTYTPSSRPMSYSVIFNGASANETQNYFFTETEITVPNFVPAYGKVFEGWLVTTYGKNLVSLTSPLTTAEKNLYKAEDIITLSENTYGNIAFTAVESSHVLNYSTRVNGDGIELVAKCSNSSHSDFDCYKSGALLFLKPVNAHSLSNGNIGWKDYEKVNFELKNVEDWQRILNVSSVPSIYYKGIGSTTYTASLSKPKTIGSYRAYISFGSTTATVDFNIIKHNHVLNATILREGIMKQSCECGFYVIKFN